MENCIQTVYDLLLEQKSVQEQLLEFAAEKRQVIIDNNTDRLNEIVASEYKLLSKMNNIEKRRASAIAEASVKTGVPEESMTVSELARHAGDEMSDKLEGIRDELSGLIKRLRDSNELNRDLIKAQLEYTDIMLNLYGGGNDPINNFYGTDGRASSADIGKGAGLFDTEI